MTHTHIHTYIHNIHYMLAQCMHIHAVTQLSHAKIVCRCIQDCGLAHAVTHEAFIDPNLV